jgi:ribosomal protein L33
MMAHITVTKVIPEHREEVIVKLKCDSCGKDSPFGRNWSTSYNGSTTIKFEKYVDMPFDNNKTDITEYDICPDCFDKIAKTFNFGSPTKRWCHK